jgi:hypothetical protein
MTTPHEKATEDRKEAAEEVKQAYKDLCEAAGMPVEEDL